MYESKNQMVSHPPHYQSKAGLEVIDVVEAFTADLTGIEATDTGNIIKYICRWKHKNGIEDLEKAKWYLDHLIKKVRDNRTEFVFATRGDAETMLAKLDTILCDYGVLRVDDICNELHIECPVSDGPVRGWTDISSARVEKMSDGYIIVLPKPINLT